VSRRRREMYGHARLCVCLCVCLSAAVCPHYCTDPGVTGGVVGDTPSCAVLGGFAIDARAALLWQHNANAKCQREHACTRSMPSYTMLTTRHSEWPHWKHAHAQCIKKLYKSFSKCKKI